MYFRKYWPRKTGLDKCLETPASEDLCRDDMTNGAKNWFNLNQSAFIILSDHFEGNWVAKITLRNMKILQPFLNTVTAFDKYSLISRDKWLQTSQIHLSQKQNVFSPFLSAFFESALNFEHFQKRWRSELMYFQNYRPRKTCLDKCLKGPVWEDPSTGYMVNGPKHWFNLNESTFIILNDHCEDNWVANVTLRHMKFLQMLS